MMAWTRLVAWEMRRTGWTQLQIVLNALRKMKQDNKKSCN